MSIKLGSDDIIIKRAPLVTDTRDNTQYRDWANATETPVKNCNVQPFLLTDKLKVERNMDREFVDDTWRVWAPPGTDVLYTDRVEFRGIEYEVRGLSGEWRDLEGHTHHVNFMIRRREG